MLEQNIFQLISPLIPFMEDGLCDKYIHREIAKIDYVTLDYSFSFFLNQTKINDLSYLYTSVYIIDPLDCNVKCVGELCTKDEDEWKICFQKSSELLHMDILSLDTMFCWIKKNSSQRYLAIPITFNPEYGVNNSSHACTLVIDNALQEIYFFDPNGTIGYFGNDSEYLLDFLMEKYFEDFELKYSMGYRYIHTKKVNSLGLCLNRKFEGSSIENFGNCMILSILFVHFLHLTQKTAYDGVQILGSLNNSSLLHIINNYSVGFYNYVLHRVTH